MTTDNYKIPSEIKDQLTEDFYSAMWEELIRIFGDDKVIGFDPYGFPNVEQLEGTCGWHDALDRCAPKEAIDHFNQLDWWDGDLFDGEIGEELAKRFAKPTNAGRIRNMADEELAQFLYEFGGSSPNCNRVSLAYDYKSCKDCWLDWLKQETDI